MEPVKNIEVNSRKYVLKMFSPIEAFDYIFDYTHARAVGMNTKALGYKAICQCRDEMGRELSDKTVFDTHFGQYPEDMLELEAVARTELMFPFSRSGKSTE